MTMTMTTTTMIDNTLTTGDTGRFDNNTVWYPGNQSGDYIPWWQTYPPYRTYPSVVWQTPIAATECSGDVHVFPCNKCGECKCGAANIAKRKRR